MSGVGSISGSANLPRLSAQSTHAYGRVWVPFRVQLTLSPWPHDPTLTSTSGVGSISGSANLHLSTDVNLPQGVSGVGSISGSANLWRFAKPIRPSSTSGVGSISGSANLYPELTLTSHYAGRVWVPFRVQLTSIVPDVRIIGSARRVWVPFRVQLTSSQ